MVTETDKKQTLTGARQTALAQARKQLIESHQDEFNQLVEANMVSQGYAKRQEVKEVWEKISLA